MKRWSVSLIMFFGALTVKAQTNVVFYTSMGNFMVEIREDLVPITGNNFLDLVNDEFYDGIIFHRVIDNFMIQSGDPTGTGTGGPGYTIEDEFHPDMDNAQMTISMANTGAPDSGGSQFFINLVDNFYLDYDVDPLEYAHAVFGIVTEGFEIVQDIGGVATNVSDRPISDVVIDSIRVTDDFVPASIVSSELPEPVVKVFPNPITENSIISIYSEVTSVSQVALYDSYGRLAGMANFELSQGQNQFSIAPLLTKDCAAGIYHLRVTIDNTTQHIRLSL